MIQRKLTILFFLLPIILSSIAIAPQTLTANENTSNNFMFQESDVIQIGDDYISLDSDESLYSFSLGAIPQTMSGVADSQNVSEVGQRTDLTKEVKDEYKYRN